MNILDKNAIYAINISATQELERKVERQEILINHLLSRIEALEDS